MKISEREKILLAFVAIIMIAFLFFMFLLPPALDNLKALREKNNGILNEIAIVQENMAQEKALKDEYKALNIKALAFSNQFYSELAQERIILDLNKLLLDSGLSGHNLSFREEEKIVKKGAAQKKTAKRHSLADLPKMIVSVSYSGTFNELLTFLHKLGEFDRKILVERMDIINTTQKSGANNLAGNLTLEFYAVPALLNGATEFLSGDFTGVIGGNDPFSGVSLVDANVADILMGRTKSDLCDFVLTVKPITADLPTVVLGLDADVSAESFVCADNPEVENAELRLFMKDGQYLCAYKTEQQSYPYHGEGVEIPFVGGERELVMKIFSNPRTGATDLSGVNLRLYNETDRRLVVNLINDDPEKPRVKLVEQSGYIEVR